MVGPIDIAIIVFAALLGVLRIVGVKHLIFQATAHLFVGGLFGAWLKDRKDRILLITAIVLSMVELLCFLLLR